MTSIAIKLLAGAALVAAIIFGWNHYIDGVRAEADAQGYARRDTEQKTADNKALREALAEVARLKTELQGISDDAKKQKDAVAAAAASARDAGERLRAAEARLRAALGQRACPGAVPAAGSAPADAALGVLADVQRRLDEAAERTARFADESRIAGLACERSYDALK